MNQISDRVRCITDKIKQAKQALIIVSKPIDPDCIGSALVIGWWIEKVYAGSGEVEIVSFFPLKNLIFGMPCAEKVKEHNVHAFDFMSYDLYILVDGGDWKQFFTNEWQQILISLDREKVVHLDHHQAGIISESLGKKSLRVKECCTAKVIYDHFIKSSGYPLEKDMATCLYKALIGDTGNFRYQMYADTYEFADILYKSGADHEKAVEVYLSREMMDYMRWAIEHTRYYKEAKSTLLVVDQATRKSLWDRYYETVDLAGLDRYYKSVFMTLVMGYPYALMFEFMEKGVKVSWRTKTGSPLDVGGVLHRLGFEVGGHRNAGGGMIHDTNMEGVVNAFLEEMVEQVRRVEATAKKVD